MKVATTLRNAGHEVFVPHEASYNEEDSDATDEDIYLQDMSEVIRADAAVVAGRIGVDCAFEIGWFQAHGVPTVWYVPSTADIGRHPMLFEVARCGSLKNVLRFLSGQGMRRLLPRKVAT